MLKEFTVTGIPVWEERLTTDISFLLLMATSFSALPKPEAHFGVEW